MAALPKNRIANDSSSPADHVQKVRPAPVKAYRVVAWRCPSCSLAQFAERTATHLGRCARCGTEYTVHVPPV